MAEVKLFTVKLYPENNPYERTTKEPFVENDVLFLVPQNTQWGTTVYQVIKLVDGKADVAATYNQISRTEIIWP
jgi:hypothetical protein